MRTELREKQMRSYFIVDKARTPTFGLLIQFSFGVILFGVFILYFFKNTEVVGTLFMLIGLVLFAIWVKPFFRGKQLYGSRPVEAKMNQWLIQDLSEIIKKTAIEKLLLNASTLKPHNFIIVPCPVYWQEPDIEGKDIHRRETESEHMLYSVWTVQVLALTVNYISFYTCTYDWLNNKIVNERTNEYFYDDITSVKNDIESVSRQLLGEDEPTTLTASIFKISNISADKQELITSIIELKQHPELIVSLEKMGQVLRNILRKRRDSGEQKPNIIKKSTERTDDIES